jgi:formylglycine-generating enzyme required for sulfatase activity
MGVKPGRYRPTAVGGFPPGLFGLYDMRGDVDEWPAKNGLEKR